MEQAHIDSLVRLYNLTLVVLLAAIGFGALGIFGVFGFQYTGYADVTSGLLGFIVFVLVAALPGIIWLFLRSREIAGLEKPEQVIKLRSIWKVQMLVGTLNLVGTITLLIIFLLTVLLFSGAPAGLAVFTESPLGYFTVLTLFPSVLGSVFHFLALSLRRKMASPMHSPIV